jgi:spore coat polysaccharide biosynthesis protein SpsF
MTGRDSETQLLHAARGLASLAPVFRARFVIGSGMKNGATVARKILNLATHFETLEGAEDLATDYTACDLAMTDFGLAAFELAASGVPAIYLCQSEDAVLSAQAFERAGVGRSLGLAARLPDGQVGRAAWGLLADAQGRRQMRLAGPAIIDGQGATRLADDLVMALASRRVAATRRAVQ